ncbi:hypothetical protein ARMSODRAFT_209004 [Armillaria solidipes]|uniref:Uncharacterized protein n=1 Tax=Armillaria solidipes TaxID=1076256 RepID=A0A2H3BBA4_9AGAR|nr:hypothetical protein ARMSODRAFT_209004 [Armillaria solidipes]
MSDRVEKKNDPDSESDLGIPDTRSCPACDTVVGHCSSGRGIAAIRASVDGKRPAFSTCMKREHQLFLFIVRLLLSLSLSRCSRSRALLFLCLRAVPSTMFVSLLLRGTNGVSVLPLRLAITIPRRKVYMVGIFVSDRMPPSRYQAWKMQLRSRCAWPSR